MKVAIIQKSRDFNKFKNENVNLFLGTNSQMSDLLKNRGVNFISLAKYEKAHNFDKNATEWFNEMINKKIRDVSLKEMFKVKNMSLFWLMQLWIFYSYNYSYPMRKVISILESLEYFIKDKKPSEVYFVDYKNLISSLVTKICNKHKIKTNIKKTLNLKIKLPPLNYIFVVRSMIRKIFLSPFVKKNPESKFKLLFFPTSSGKSKSPYLGEVFEKLGDNKKDVGWVERLPEYQNNLINLIQLKNVRSEDTLFLETFVDSKSIKESILLTKENIRYYEKIKRSKEWFSLFIYKGYNLWNLLKEQFDFYFHFRMNGHILNFILIEKLIESVKPKSVLFPTEGGPFATSLFAICNKKKIKTFAVQHGTMSYSPNLIHGKENLNETDKGFPLPDITFVYGKYYQDFLIKKAGYNKKQVQITGNPRFDHFKRYLGLKNKTQKNEIILLTQRLPNKEARKDIVITTLNVIKRLGLNNLTIKLHPAETHKDLLVYKNIAKKFDTIKVKFIKKCDNAELLNRTSVLIGPESTFFYEAMIMRVPIILLGFENLDEFLDYFKEKVVLRVTDEKELFLSLKNLLYKPKLRKELIKKSKKFIKNHCYKFDGDASLRIALNINKYIKESKQQ